MKKISSAMIFLFAALLINGCNPGTDPNAPAGEKTQKDAQQTGGDKTGGDKTGGDKTGGDKTGGDANKGGAGGGDGNKGGPGGPGGGQRQPAPVATFTWKKIELKGGFNGLNTSFVDGDQIQRVLRFSNGAAFFTTNPQTDKSRAARSSALRKMFFVKGDKVALAIDGRVHTHSALGKTPELTLTEEFLMNGESVYKSGGVDYIYFNARPVGGWGAFVGTPAGAGSYNIYIDTTTDQVTNGKGLKFTKESGTISPLKPAYNMNTYVDNLTEILDPSWFNENSKATFWTGGIDDDVSYVVIDNQDVYLRTKGMGQPRK